LGRGRGVVSCIFPKKKCLFFLLIVFREMCYAFYCFDFRSDLEDSKFESRFEVTVGDDPVAEVGIPFFNLPHFISVSGFMLLTEVQGHVPSF
jgi:hypothetical protein